VLPGALPSTRGADLRSVFRLKLASGRAPMTRCWIWYPTVDRARSAEDSVLMAIAIDLSDAHGRPELVEM